MPGLPSELTRRRNFGAFYPLTNSAECGIIGDDGAIVAKGEMMDFETFLTSFLTHLTEGTFPTEAICLGVLCLGPLLLLPGIVLTIRLWRRILKEPGKE